MISSLITEENKKANIGPGGSLRFTDYISFDLSGQEYIRVSTCATFTILSLLYHTFILHKYYIILHKLHLIILFNLSFYVTFLHNFLTIIFLNT